MSAWTWAADRRTQVSYARRGAEQRGHAPEQQDGGGMRPRELRRHPPRARVGRGICATLFLFLCRLA
jgi:hypothetical protein